MKNYQCPDIIFPSSNEFGIPDLPLDAMPTELTPPLTKWGDIGRKRPMLGTYHFYTDDYKYEAIWKRPQDVIKSGCQAIIETDFTHGNGQPLAVFLWDLYRKRWLSRFWYDHGMKIWCNLSVAIDFRRYILLGIPKGYLAYATRGLDKDFDLILNDYERAKNHAGRDPLFLVYGGGQLIESLCITRNWMFQPENMHCVDGRRDKRHGLQLRIEEVYHG